LSEINQTIARLRALSQVDVQSGWRYWDGELPLESAVKSQQWQNWAIAPLNAKGHLAWEQGRRVRWLGQEIGVPVDLQGYSLAGMTLRLALTWWAEAAEIFVNGRLVQAGDLFDCATRLCLSSSVQAGDRFTVALRLVSPGHDDGALVRSRCVYEAPPEAFPEPGFVADELAVVQIYLQAFSPQQIEAVQQAVDQIDWSVIRDRVAFDRRLQRVRSSLLPLSDGLKQRQIRLLGHAHLDLAWLWTVSDTWEAAERTFASVLSLQADFPELIFCHSTPALYDWLERHRPTLFARIQQQVQAGRWEPVGGLWVEPELNLISGESLVRQVLYGQRYCQSRFGSLSRIAWLPDSFGFCWQLPQILRQGGMDYFVTQKLRWNDTTQFPHDLFGWRSPDGSQIIALMSAPIGKGVDPVKLATYSADWEAKTGQSSALWLPGVGDHGGGPTRDMLEIARRWQRSPLFASMEFTTALDYLETVSQTADLPVWESDLYLEFHRGCYTSHADQKQFNRQSEDLLYQAELWATLATLTTGCAYPGESLEIAWKQVLFNQFHDILPGSSIPEVFEDANRDWQAALTCGKAILQSALQAIAAQISLPGDRPGTAIAVFNSLNWKRTAIARLQPPHPGTWQIVTPEGQPIPSQMNDAGDLLFLTANLPAIGYQTYFLQTLPLNSAPRTGEGLPAGFPPSPSYTLENDYLSVTISPQTGNLTSLFDKRQQREILREEGNQLQAFVDQGQYWDAWNIDPDYGSHPLPAAQLTEISQLASGPVEQRVRVIRRIGQSEFRQDYVLQAGSPVLRMETTVDWQERHVLVKAAFPLNLDGDAFTCEIPAGAMQRPLRPQTPQEKAQWEVPALGWADLADDTSGVSLISDYKHGYDAQPDRIRLTLLRGSEWPDPDADRGLHQFTYALYPHAGSWETAGTVQRSRELNPPPVVMPVIPSATASLPPTQQFLHLGAENLMLMAFKPAEDDPQTWILRCYDSQGIPSQLNLNNALGLAVTGRCNLLEQAIAGMDENLGKWAIASFQLRQP